jgi:hypothetical protein
MGSTGGGVTFVERERMKTSEVNGRGNAEARKKGREKMTKRKEEAHAVCVIFLPSTPPSLLRALK